MTGKEKEEYISRQLGHKTKKGGMRLEIALALAKELFNEGDTILDVGAGSRWNLGLWKTEGVVGFDLHDENMKGNIIGDMHEMKDQYGKWDNVFCSHTLEHAYDYNKVLEEFKMVARKGIFIVIPLETVEEAKNDIHHECRITSWGVIKHFNYKWSIRFWLRVDKKELMLYAKRSS